MRAHEHSNCRTRAIRKLDEETSPSTLLHKHNTPSSSSNDSQRSRGERHRRAAQGLRHRDSPGRLCNCQDDLGRSDRDRLGWRSGHSRRRCRRGVRPSLFTGLGVGGVIVTIVVVSTATGFALVGIVVAYKSIEWGLVDGYWTKEV